MPFLGQDWRSNGEQWVRTAKGWERLRWWRMKLFENLNENVLARLLKLDEVQLYQQHVEVRQPHVTLAKNTREMRTKVTLSEAFSQLDLSAGVRDIRRFGYICKVMEILLREKLHCVSGSGQKVIFTLLEEIVQQVLRIDNNIHVAQGLLNDTKLALHKYQYDHVGSESLWRKHQSTVDSLQLMVDRHHSRPRADDGRLTMSDLPTDVMRQILKCLADHRDVVRVGLTERKAYDIVEEELTWRQLCLYHFGDIDLTSVVRKGESFEDLTWKQLHGRLARRYGLQEKYAEMLHLCSNCNALYWNGHGHPCQVTSEEPRSVAISPNHCVQLFCA